jgi:flagellum-specific ATP synthase
MGAYRAGADPLLDRAIAMNDGLRQFLGQGQHERVSLEQSITALQGLIGHAAG